MVMDIMLNCVAIHRKHIFVTICVLVAVGIMLSMKENLGYNTAIRYAARNNKSEMDLEESVPTNTKSPDILREMFGKSRTSSEVVSDHPYSRIFPYSFLKVKCGGSSNEKVENFFGKMNSDMSNWTFQEKIECPEKTIGDTYQSNVRRKMSIHCTNDSVLTWYSDTMPSDNVHTLDFGDPCLDRYIQKCCMGGQRIPNVIHYVWYMRGELSFVPFMSLLSAIRFVQPCVIVFHGQAPYGKYWDAFLNFWPDVVLLKRDRPEIIFGQQVKHTEHSSDVMRIEALIQYGGIYMDTDTLLVRSVDVLRQYPCVMSNQSSGLLGSAFVMSEKNGSFVQKWYDGYIYHYFPEKYIYNAMVYPNKLVRDSSKEDIIHIEYGTVSRPIDMIGGKLYYNNYTTHNWSYIYGVHLYSRIYKEPVNETTIRQMNTTFGSISRHVYYGNKELCL